MNVVRYVIVSHCLLFLNVLKLYFYLQVRDQVSHPHSTTGKIVRFIGLKMSVLWVVAPCRLV
jgi:hypothetical protein